MKDDPRIKYTLTDEKFGFISNRCRARIKHNYSKHDLCGILKSGYFEGIPCIQETCPICSWIMALKLWNDDYELY